MSLPILPADAVPIMKDAPARAPKAPWLRVKAPSGETFEKLLKLRESKALHTVCESAACPNLGECWGRGTATFMIGGNLCTRACRFCDVQSGRPEPLDVNEPQRVAEAVAALGLKFAVITAVARDDLPDGGAQHFADVIHAVRKLSPGVGVEVLIPNFLGDEGALKIVMDARPDVLNHNVETVERLTPEIRGKAKYRRTLTVLKNAKRMVPTGLTKTGIMLGMGEVPDEVDQTLRDLREHDVDLLTVGQYLAPSDWHRPVTRYVHPDEFKHWETRGKELGFKLVASGPLVRSSYHAEHASELLKSMVR